jgi:hypothetical protein
MNRAKIYVNFERIGLKEIRQGLKKEFNHKFNVTRGKGRCVNSIHISWVEGPTIGQINSFCERYVK